MNLGVPERYEAAFRAIHTGATSPLSRVTLCKSTLALLKLANLG